MKAVIREIPVWILTAIGAFALLALEATLDAPTAADECQLAGRPALHGLLTTPRRTECQPDKPRLTA
ncbi:hypothetical protein [Burkholderia ubonensis]|uniref:hypothetical protein n=1 Tax=Burkholderia ubonensis TaxID=101571 RepID=UPI000751ACBF|nr:hypothetical protein [Burkholderia ubonensis]